MSCTCLCALLPMEVSHQLGFQWPLSKPQTLMARSCSWGKTASIAQNGEVRQREGARGGVGNSARTQLHWGEALGFVTGRNC